MSDRIKELAEQAWDDTREKFGSFIDDGGSVDFTFLHAYDKKFAELIVFECVNAVMDGTNEGDHYAMRIEQHFDNEQGGILHFGIE